MKMPLGKIKWKRIYFHRLLSKPGQNGFQEPLQDLRADILQPAANAREQTVIIQTGSGTTMLVVQNPPHVCLFVFVPEAPAPVL